jgi:hypothetical protein
VPAPAVIPAPRAYINAVAVKGFVVELRATERTGPSFPPRVVTPALGARERSKLPSQKRISHLRAQCAQ